MATKDIPEGDFFDDFDDGVPGERDDTLDDLPAEKARLRAVPVRRSASGQAAPEESSALVKFKTLDIWNDPLVQETVKAAERTVTQYMEAYGDFYNGPDHEQEALLKILEETEALDPVTAAVFYLETALPEMRRQEDVQGLPQSVQDTLQALDQVRDAPMHAFESGYNPQARSLFLAHTLTEGRNLPLELDEEVGSFMIPIISGIAMEAIEKMMDHGTWTEIPPKLLDQSLGMIEKITAQDPSRTRKGAMQGLLTAFKAEVAKATVEEIVAPAVDPEIDPAFKDLAKKAKGKFTLGPPKQ